MPSAAPGGVSRGAEGARGQAGLRVQPCQNPCIRRGKGAETTPREEPGAGAAPAGDKTAQGSLIRDTQGPGVALLCLMEGFAREEIGPDTRRMFVAAGKGSAERASSQKGSWGRCCCQELAQECPAVPLGCVRLGWGLQGPMGRAGTTSHSPRHPCRVVWPPWVP